MKKFQSNLNLDELKKKEETFDEEEFDINTID